MSTSQYFLLLSVIVSKTRKGFVRFVGPTEFAPGIWVGVELEEPRGKNNGTVDGKKYFNCKVFWVEYGGISITVVFCSP